MNNFPLSQLNVLLQARYYQSLGLDTLPLPSNSKKILTKGWPNRSSEELWAGAPEDSNLAIRCGGVRNLCVIDCDDRIILGTAERVVSHLAKIGLPAGSYPLVKSASGIGYHAYVSLINPPSVRSCRKIENPFMSGEVRYGQGAYVVAPPSRIFDAAYCLVSGDFAVIPTIAWEDLEPLLPGTFRNQVPQPKPQTEDATKAIRSLRVPAKVLSMLRGRGRENYRSGSELDQAILTNLANHNDDLEFEDVLKLFSRSSLVGRFHDLSIKSEDTANAYLLRSFQTAVEFSQTESLARTTLRKLILKVESEIWPGIRGLRLKAVFLAHLEVAFAAGGFEYAASVRQLSELCGQTIQVVSRSTKSLISSGSLALLKPSKAIFSHQYKIGITDDPLTHSRGGIVSSIFASSPIKENRYIQMLQNDLFSPRALNLTGLEIYWRLQAGPLTDRELAGLTGLSIATVRRVLKKMGQLEAPIVETGELLPMVVKQGDYFRVNSELNFDLLLTKFQNQLDEQAAGSPHKKPTLISGRRERMIYTHKKERSRFRAKARNLQFQQRRGK